MKKSEPVLDSHRETFAIVGELVLLSNALDYELDKVLIAVLGLGQSAMIEPVVATLDAVRKVEILKNFVAHFSEGSFKQNLEKFVENIERVNNQRNIACHTHPALTNEKFVFKPKAAAKMLKKLDILTGTLPEISTNEFKTAISLAEQALAESAPLIENFKKLHVARVKKFQDGK